MADAQSTTNTSSEDPTDLSEGLADMHLAEGSSAKKVKDADPPRSLMDCPAEIRQQILGHLFTGQSSRYQRHEIHHKYGKELAIFTVCRPLRDDATYVLFNEPFHYTAEASRGCFQHSGPVRASTFPIHAHDEVQRPEDLIRKLEVTVYLWNLNVSVVESWKQLMTWAFWWKQLPSDRARNPPSRPWICTEPLVLASHLSKLESLKINFKDFDLMMVTGSRMREILEWAGFRWWDEAGRMMMNVTKYRDKLARLMCLCLGELLSGVDGKRLRKVEITGLDEATERYVLEVLGRE